MSYIQVNTHQHTFHCAFFVIVVVRFCLNKPLPVCDFTGVTDADSATIAFIYLYCQKSNYAELYILLNERSQGRRQCQRHGL